MRGYHWKKWVLHEPSNQGLTRLWLDRKRVTWNEIKSANPFPRKELQLLIERWPESKISKQRSNPTVHPQVPEDWTSGLPAWLWRCVAWLRKRRKCSSIRRANSTTTRWTNCRRARRVRRRYSRRYRSMAGVGKLPERILRHAATTFPRGGRTALGKVRSTPRPALPLHSVAAIKAGSSSRPRPPRPYETG